MTARIEKTVFISYRRADVYTALAVYENLKNQGYDVFFDYRSISSGDFEQIIISNIRARGHFLLILTPTALDRCNEPGDWLRREIETAIDEKRNIVPLFFKGFRFGAPSSSGKSKWLQFRRSFVSDTLTGKLRELSRYNGLNVHEDYFEEAMRRLRTEFLTQPLDTVLHPVSTEVQKLVREEQVAADEALEEIEDVKELVKHDHDKPIQAKAEIASSRSKSDPSTAGDILQRDRPVGKTGAPASKVAAQSKRALHNGARDVTVSPTVTEKSISPPNFNFRFIARRMGGVLLLALLIWGGANIFENPLPNTPGPTLNSPVVSTQTPQPLEAIPPAPTRTLTPGSTQSSQTVKTLTHSPTSAFGVVSTATGNDGMTLLYVQEGKFTMGIDVEDALDECRKWIADCQSDWLIFNGPAHTVELDAFWIDRTEVTNKLYSSCVEAGVCEQPKRVESQSRSEYYGNPEYDNYPVIYVDWNMAKIYCEWAGRRLPTEAEWEKAARGIDERLYPWGNDAPNVNLLSMDESADTTKVGRYLNGASPYGALDMAGNVEEWVADRFGSAYYAASLTFNPLGPNEGDQRVLRGGSTWVAESHLVSSFSRNSGYSWFEDFYIGFRCAMDAAP